jgi:hypothetical protein
MVDSDSYTDCISEIIPGFLFIGGCYSVENRAFFTDRGVGFALNASDGLEKIF